jgi:predicted nucleotidyltransferase component of viral defense system
LKAGDLMAWIEEATQKAAEQNGPDFAASPPRLEIIEDEYGSESFQVRVYFRGPLRWAGSPRAIRLDITRNERLLLPAAQRDLTHPYSDAATIKEVAIPCYDLKEVLAEKLRAVGGQRRFAISRDLYDIHRLVTSGVSVHRVARLLPDKFAARGVEITSLNIEHHSNRRTEFEIDWQRRLTYLVPDDQAVAFDAAWQNTIEVIQLVQTLLS